MPWLATDAVKERTKFVLKWEERFNAAEGGRVNVAELCRMFGISRQAGRLDRSLSRDRADRRARGAVATPAELTAEGQHRIHSALTAQSDVRGISGLHMG